MLNLVEIPLPPWSLCDTLILLTNPPSPKCDVIVGFGNTQSLGVTALLDLRWLQYCYIQISDLSQL
jgi:hypothetical protein